jgi:secreted trypsin-like serine protease
MAFYDNSWVLAGITSIGEGCAEATHPGIYTRVSSFISFIEANLDGSFAATIGPTTTTSNKSNSGSVIIKSISILIFSFLFLVFY